MIDMVLVSIVACYYFRCFYYLFGVCLLFNVVFGQSQKEFIRSGGSYRTQEVSCEFLGESALEEGGLSPKGPLLYARRFRGTP